MKHTPGPWKVKTVDTQVGHCHRIMPITACLYVDNQKLPRDAINRDSVVALANARLIAAAPEMYEALTTLAKLGDEGMTPNYEEWLTFHGKVSQIAHAAIAKAEGGMRDDE